MSKHDFQFAALLQTLDEKNYLAEALFFPELTRYRPAAEATKDDLRANLTRIVEEDLAPLERHRRHFTSTPEVATVTLELTPPERNSAVWRNPVTLDFPHVRWQHGEHAHLAYVPSLGIEIVATSAEDLTARIPQEIRAHLLRTKATTSLGKLIWLQRCQALTVETLSFSAELRTPKQLAMQEAQPDEAKKSVLEEVTTDLTKTSLPAAYEIDNVVARLAEAFTGLTPKSALLVGKSGVGKTAAVYELVRRRAHFQLARTPFRATSGARLVAGMSGYGMWQERCEKLWREASKEKVILHLGNLIELMEVGKSESSSQGIAGFLRPYIARGALLVIAECTPEQLPLIERSDPHLLAAFHRITVDEPMPEKGRAILRQFAAAARRIKTPPEELLRVRKVTKPLPITSDALARLDQLHRRYATYSAYPGRPLRFLKNLLKDNEQTVTASDVTAAFSRETGLPLFLLEESQRLDLTEAQHWFSARVIGQAEAVNLIVDLLALVKADLVRPRKPIASLLFIGPTGTGKTEMAKSLAEFLFQDRNRMVRFDMSEYSDPNAVQRLIGSGGTEGLLTAKVREQPFAVILLDEIEKAHPQFFDLLLQVLGEGRLTDALGRVADFCNAVVIMTSNLGAESYQRGVKGFAEAFAPEESRQRKRASQHFLKEVRAFVRPELFNRLDRVVPFAPLSADTVQRIAERELEKLKQRDGLKYRGVLVDLAAEVAAHLAERGYDVRYGARPLKRTLERELLAPLAEQLNQRSAGERLQADVTLSNGALQVKTQPQLDEAGKRAQKATAQTHLAHLTRDATTMRGFAQRLARGAAMIGWQNQLYRLQLIERRVQLNPKKWQRPEDLAALARLPKLRQALQAAQEFSPRIFALEDEALLMMYGRTTPDVSSIQQGITALQHEWEQLLWQLYSLQFDKPDRATLLIVSESVPHLFQLARAYFQYATQQNIEVQLHSLSKRAPGKKEAVPAGELELQPIKHPAKFLRTDDDTVISLTLSLAAPFVFPRFANEQGIHLFKADKKEVRCLVEVTPEALPKQPNPRTTARSVYMIIEARQDIRRLYNADQYIIEDKLLDKRWPWNGSLIDTRMAEAIEESLAHATQSLLDD